MANLCNICTSLLTLRPDAKPCQQCARNARLEWEYKELPSAITVSQDAYKAETRHKRAIARYERDRRTIVVKQAEIDLANKRAKIRRKAIRDRATRRLALRMFYKRIGIRNPLGMIYAKEINSLIGANMER